MATLDDVCDYVITKASEARMPLNLLKLQKLVYYCQAWHLANEGHPLFDGKFQAWVHGPVSRRLYDRFRNSKNLYSMMDLGDRRAGFDGRELTEDERV
ncbi:MAG: Panacea domain-containing protein [Polyangiaceae bacterium]